MNLSWTRWVTVALVVAGCGGRTDEEGDEGAGPSDPPTSSPDEGEDEPGDEPNEPNSPTSRATAGSRLPGCENGFDASAERERPCNWLAKGLCYEEKLDAPAPACARVTAPRRASCSSGFPVEDGQVDVYCY